MPVNRSCVSVLAGLLLSTVAVCSDAELIAVRSVNDTIVIDPAVELALTIAALTDIGRSKENYEPINRQTDYYKTVSGRFAKWRGHEVVLALGGDFNLPRLAGNAADFVVAADGSLRQRYFDGSLWDDQGGDLFRQHIALISDFSQQSDFRQFFESHADMNRELVSAVQAALDIDSMVAWLERNFSERPSRPTIYISRLLQGHHWTSAEYQKEFRIWVNAYSAEEVASFSAMRKAIFAGSVFTELDHRYVNPATEKFAADISNAMSDRRLWATDRAWRSYPTPMLVFNEYFTHASYLLFLRNQMRDQEFAAILQNRIQQMEQRRGFILYGSFVRAMFALVDSTDASVEKRILPMINWCADVQQQGISEPVSLRRPSVLQSTR